MPSPAQLAANRDNARKSTGPKTPAGKAASSNNSRQHGLTARDLVLQSGEEDEFNSLNDSLYDEIRPEGPLEHEAFRHLLIAAWNQRRCARAESELQDLVYPDDIDPLLDSDLQKRLRLLDLYSRRNASAYLKAQKNLRDLQNQRHLRACLAVPEPAALDALAPRLADLSWIHDGILKKRTQSARLQAAQNREPAGQTPPPEAPPTSTRDLPEVI